MPKRSKYRRGGFVTTLRKQLQVGDLMSREAPEGLFRVVSIKGKEVWIEGTFATFLEAKKIADDKAVDGVVCYMHGHGPRVLYIAR
tara:strand:- start:533 stop:790 length:258 start_codon:yes stop_codon:yes gene_type:complete